MTHTAKQFISLFLAVAVLGVLAWRLWPDGGQARRQQRNSELLNAVSQNRLTDATHLLGEGADPNTQTPPTSLAEKVSYYRFLRLSGAKVMPWGHMADRNQHYSVLEVATMHGNADMVGLLLSKGADVTHRDRAGDTALDRAEIFDRMPKFGALKNRDDTRVVVLLKAARAKKKGRS